MYYEGVDQALALLKNPVRRMVGHIAFAISSVFDYVWFSSVDQLNWPTFCKCAIHTWKYVKPNLPFIRANQGEPSSPQVVTGKSRHD